MFRASSEMAVATSVASVREKPSLAASSRPSCRARIRSVSEPMAIRRSSFSAFGLLDPSIEEGQSLFQVQFGLDLFAAEAQLADGEGHLPAEPHAHELC